MDAQSTLPMQKLRRLPGIYESKESSANQPLLPHSQPSEYWEQKDRIVVLVITGSAFKFAKSYRMALGIQDSRLCRFRA